MNICNSHCKNHPTVDRTSWDHTQTQTTGPNNTPTTSTTTTHNLQISPKHLTIAVQLLSTCDTNPLISILTGLPNLLRTCQTKPEQRRSKESQPADVCFWFANVGQGKLGDCKVWWNRITVSFFKKKTTNVQNEADPTQTPTCKAEMIKEELMSRFQTFRKRSEASQIVPGLFLSSTQNLKTQEFSFHLLAENEPKHRLLLRSSVKIFIAPPNTPPHEVFHQKKTSILNFWGPFVFGGFHTPTKTFKKHSNCWVGYSFFHFLRKGFKTLFIPLVHNNIPWFWLSMKIMNNRIGQPTFRPTPWWNKAPCHQDTYQNQKKWFWSYRMLSLISCLCQIHYSPAVFEQKKLKN